MAPRLITSRRAFLISGGTSLATALRGEDGRGRAPAARVQLEYGLEGSYFNLDDGERVPQMPDRPAEVTNLDPQLQFEWGRSGPFGARGAIGPRFAARWRGYLHVPGPGVVTFQLCHRDGARFLLNGETIYDGWRRANRLGAFLPHESRRPPGFPSRSISTAGSAEE
ncbi:MAG: hypothetical protein JNK87_24190 [Bryobacterales bacterium]|nr:hypothetical protein [Bryobacterales bacterium]